MISHTAFFGDGVKTFTLTDTVINELQHTTGVGIGALFRRVVEYREFRLTDITEIIRLGLVGGGMKTEDAARLIETYAKDRPFDETIPLALDILTARWTGKLEEPEDDFDFPQDETRQAAASGDLAAAISAAYQDVE